MTNLEAGWGFVPEERSLLIFTSILPCTVALEYDDSVPDGVTLRNRHCYDEAAAKIEAYTGAQTDASQGAASRMCHLSACRLRWASCSICRHAHRQAAALYLRNDIVLTALHALHVHG